MQNKNRCFWVGDDPLMILYHDKEWGVPVFDDNKIFEFLVLESMQAGLSWKTILHKREGYRKSFYNFSPKKVANFDSLKIENLLKNEEIIRHRLKIESIINNAKKFLRVQKEFGSFSKYVWSFVKNTPINGQRKNRESVPTNTRESILFSKDLKKRGFKFLGPVTVYAFMQAVGMINDHTVDCFCYKNLVSK